MAQTGRPPAPPSLGQPPEQYTSRWASDLTAKLSREIGLKSSANTAQGQLLLQAPDGGVWKVTVDNTGTLLTAQVATDGVYKPPVP